MVRKNKQAQFKIQQMAFMIIAVFIFFTLVGLGVVGYYITSIKSDYGRVQEQVAVDSLEIIADMAELRCGKDIDFCIDKDKVRVLNKMFNRGEDYGLMWPVSEIRIEQIYPNSGIGGGIVYQIYKSSQTNVRTVATFVPLCEKQEGTYKWDWETAKLIVGIKILQE